MSFDIYVQCFRDGELVPYDRAIFDEIFGPWVFAREADFVEVGFADGSGGQIYVDDTPEIDSITVNRGGGEAFTAALFELMKRTGSVLYWPGGGCLVTDPSFVNCLPQDWVEHLGTPIVISQPSEIRARIAAS